MKIPAIIYLLVGLGVAFFSRNDPALIIFLYAGYILFAIGIIKAIIWFFSRKRGSSSRKHNAKKTAEPDIPYGETIQHKGMVKYCRKCHRHTRVIDTFCPTCGNMYFYTKK